MSRARPIKLPDGETVWFDTNRNGEPIAAALAEDQLELLATIENVEIESLLESGMSQGEVVTRLRQALGQYQLPDAVLKRRDRLRDERRAQPACRSCDKIGDSTKHHFVNRWILKNLDSYARLWADRNQNCIPLCLSCHRQIHLRDDSAKSIVDLLDRSEREFAWRALDAFCEQHPHMAMTMARGDISVYEAQLMKDFVNGRFNQD